MKSFILLVLLYIGLNSFGQQVSSSRKLNTSGTLRINAQTGEKMSDAEFVQMAKENPGLVPKLKIDKYGNIEAMIYDPEQTGRVDYRDPALRVKPGEDFPPFVMKTIDNEKLISEKLKGRKIVIHCQLFFEKPIFSEQAFKDINNLMAEKMASENIEFIVLTESSEHEIDKNLLGDYNDLRIVANGRNFSERYLITSFPCNILVDENGKLISYYNHLEFEKLKAAL